MNIVANVRTVEIAGFAAMLQGLRLPFGLEVRSQVESEYKVYDGERFCVTTNTECFIDPKDLKLIKTLIKRGDEHAKAIRAITVFAEFEVPRYIWSELDTYVVGMIPVSSESTMHIQCKGMSVEDTVEFKEHLEEKHLQKRIRGFSYQTLRRIYKQRHNHRLPHWHKICDWIKSLPLAEDLILYNLESVDNE